MHYASSGEEKEQLIPKGAPIEDVIVEEDPNIQIFKDFTDNEDEEGDDNSNSNSNQPRRRRKVKH